MANIIWIGNSFFSAKLKRPVLKLCRLDCQPGEFLDWPSLREQAAACGYTDSPDLVVVADKSLPHSGLAWRNPLA